MKAVLNRPTVIVGAKPTALPLDPSQPEPGSAIAFDLSPSLLLTDTQMGRRTYVMSARPIVEIFKGGHKATRSFGPFLGETFSYTPSCRVGMN